MLIMETFIVNRSLYWEIIFMKDTSTIYDVAEKAGISIATVSRVMNTPDKVSTGTKEKTYAAMKELGFTPKAEARERARKNVGKIGVLTPYLTYPSFVHRLRGISETLQGTPFELIIISLKESEDIEDYLQTPGLKDRIDGFIVLSQKFNRRTMKIIEDLSFNMVFVEFGDDMHTSVCIDNFKGGELVAEYLINKGFTSFGVLSENENHIDVHPNTLRIEGFRDTLAKHKIDLPEEKIVFSNYNLNEAIVSAESLLIGVKRPKAIFATTDLLAVAVMKAAKKLSIKIPEELSLIGFDGTQTSDYMDITTVDQLLEESGKLAAELLIKHIKTPLSSVQKIYLPLKILERDTVTS
jgi:LacI family transcriptional regulator